jgi:hypothetical protein
MGVEPLLVKTRVAEGIADDEDILWYFVGTVDVELEKKSRAFYIRCWRHPRSVRVHRLPREHRRIVS